VLFAICVPPDVPDVPDVPGADCKFTFQLENVPLPSAVNTSTTKAPVPPLYDVTLPSM